MHKTGISGTTGVPIDLLKSPSEILKEKLKSPVMGLGKPAIKIVTDQATNPNITAPPITRRERSNSISTPEVAEYYLRQIAGLNLDATPPPPPSEKK